VRVRVRMREGEGEEQDLPPHLSLTPTPSPQPPPPPPPHYENKTIKPSKRTIINQKRNKDRVTNVCKLETNRSNTFGNVRSAETQGS